MNQIYMPHKLERSSAVKYSSGKHTPAEVIEGIRLQPLIDLKTNTQVGSEVLTYFHDNVDVVDFFHSLTPAQYLSLFFWQANVLSHEKIRGLFFINLPVCVLSDKASIERLLDSLFSARVAIEIQDPERLGDMSLAARHRLVAGIMRLQEAGWSIWMDDVTSELVDTVNALNVQFAGVKTDREELLLRHQDPQALTGLIKKIRPQGVPILVEGIENDDDRLHAINSGATLGQGFLWPERIINETCPDDVFLAPVTEDVHPPQGKGRGKKQDWKHALIRHLQLLSETSSGQSWLTTRELAEDLGISIYTMRQRLMILVQEGHAICMKTGKGRNNILHWRAT